MVIYYRKIVLRWYRVIISFFSFLYIYQPQQQCSIGSTVPIASIKMCNAILFIFLKYFLLINLDLELDAIDSSDGMCN